jgi:hypothetical protein
MQAVALVCHHANPSTTAFFCRASTVARRVHHGLFIVRWPNRIRSRRTGSAELNPGRRSNRQWLSFNEATWTRRLIPVDPVHRIVDLFHDISNRKIIHKIWKIARPWIFKKHPETFLKSCFSPYIFTFRSLFKFL